jgi:hypothetical protein
MRKKMKEIKLILCIIIALMGFAIICLSINAYHQDARLNNHRHKIADILIPPESELEKVIKLLPEGEWEIVEVLGTKPNPIGGIGDSAIEAIIGDHNGGIKIGPQRVIRKAK